MELLIIFYAIAYFILAKLRLDWAVMLLIAVLPSYLIRLKVLGIPSTLLELMILISFATWFIWHTRFLDFIKGKYGWKELKENRKKRINYPFGWEISLLLLISYIAVAVAGFSEAALGIWKAYFFEPALVFILILNVFKYNTNDANDMRPPSLKLWRVKMTRIDLNINKVLWPLAISAFWISGVAIIERLTGWFSVMDFWPRVTGPFLYPNALGLYLAPLIMVLIGWWMHLVFVRKKRVISYQLLVIGVVIIISLVTIVLAKSEGAMAAVIVALVIFGLLAGKRVRWVTVAVVVVTAISIIGCTPARDYTIKKITLRDLSGEIRKQQWRETWTMLKDGRIILGTGLSNYKDSIRPYHQEGIFFNKDNDPEFQRKVVWDMEYHKAHWQPVEIYMYPHNIFFNFWTELGLIGMLLFVWILGKYFVYGVGALRAMPLQNGNRFFILGLICAMVAIVVHGMVDVPYFKNDLAVMFWVLIAMMSLMKLNLNNKDLGNKL